MDEEWIEKIDNYVNGTMSREEQLRFEAELAANEELASVFNLYQAIEEETLNNWNYSEQDSLLKNALQKLNQKYFGTGKQRDTAQAGEIRAEQPLVMPRTERPTVPAPSGVFETDKDYSRAIKMSGWKKPVIAAMLTGVVAMGSIWFLQKREAGSAVAVNNNKTDGQTNVGKPDADSSKKNVPIDNTIKSDKNKIPQQSDSRNTPAQVKLRRIDRERLDALYAAYSKPDALPDQKADALEEGDNSYEKGEFKEAIAGYESVITSTEIKVRGQEEKEKRTVFYAYYYRAQSYLAIDSAPKAIPDLNKAVKNTPDSHWKFKVQWYLALALLKTGKVEKAVAQLNQVTNNNTSGEYRQKATELLRILDREEKRTGGK
jgi:tetratricopeptide (TPR) repeat protein